MNYKILKLFKSQNNQDVFWQKKYKKLVFVVKMNKLYGWKSSKYNTNLTNVKQNILKQKKALDYLI